MTPSSPRSPSRRAGAEPAAARPPSTAGLAAALAVLCLLVADVFLAGDGSLAAQEGSVEAEAGVSHARPPSGLDVPAATYGLLGLRLRYGEAGRGWLWGAGYAGLGTGPDTGDWASLSGGGEIWTDPTSGFRLGLGGRGSAFTVGAPDEFRAVTGALFPQVRYDPGDDVSLRLRGLGAAGTSEVEITRPGLETGAVRTDLWYAGVEPGVVVRTEGGELTGTAAYLDARGGIYRRAGVRYAGGTETVGWSAGLEYWDTPAGEELTASVSLSFELGGPWSAHVGGGRSDPDPLLDSPTSWQGSALLGYRLAELGPDPAIPLYRISGRGDRRTVRFRLQAPDAGEVVLLGDFTGWEPVPMERTDGGWSATVQVEPGVYHFGFRVDGEWHVPEDASGRVTDDWGRTNATLVVPGS